MPERHVPVAVVGAGPYGLSIAAHLRARGTRHRVFGAPMSLWAEHMPRGMLLKSEGCASNLSDPAGAYTLRAFCAWAGLPYQDFGLPVPRETFVAYGRWFQERAVPQLEPVQVEALERTPDGRFRLRLSDGAELTAARVVLAVGVGAFAHVPPELAGLPPGCVSHTSDHVDLTPFAGRSVTLVGAGQSALETAALLHEAGARPNVLVRQAAPEWNEPLVERTLRAQLRAPRTPMGASWRLAAYLQVPDAFRLLRKPWRADIVRTRFGPAGSYWLRERILGKVPLTCAMQLRAAEALPGGRVRLTLDCDGRERVVETDHVIAATGYHVDLARLAFLPEALRARLRTYRGFPLLGGDFESSVPGLHFVGLAAALTFGPLQRFVHGARFAARRVSVAAAAPVPGARRRPGARAPAPAAGRPPRTTPSPAAP